MSLKPACSAAPIRWTKLKLPQPQGSPAPAVRRSGAKPFRDACFRRHPGPRPVIKRVDSGKNPSRSLRLSLIPCLEKLRLSAPPLRLPTVSCALRISPQQANCVRSGETGSSESRLASPRITALSRERSDPCGLKNPSRNNREPATCPPTPPGDSTRSSPAVPPHDPANPGKTDIPKACRARAGTRSSPG